jgi:hypothetical protein
MLVLGGVQNLPVDVQYEGDVKGEAIAIALSQNEPASVAPWTFKVYVHLPQGEFFIGAFTSNTAATDGAPARIVGFASCPGAKGWKLVVSCPTVNETAEVFIQSGNCCANSPFGVSVPPGGGGGGGA